MTFSSQTDFSAENTRVEDARIEDACVEDTYAENTHVENTRVGNSQMIKNRQRYLLWGVGSCLMGGMLVYGWVALRETPFSNKQEFKSSLLTGSSRINPQEAWVYQFRTESEITKKRLDAMEDMISKILKIHDSKRNETQKSFQVKSSQGTSQDLHQRDASPAALIEGLREDLKTEQVLDQHGVSAQTIQKNNLAKNGTVRPGEELPHLSGTLLPPPPGHPVSQTASTAMPGDYSPMGMQGSSSSSPPFRSKAVRKISLSLRNARSNMPLKTVDNTIPAGAFAKAVLLGGVDASASIQASSDPRPALLRIMDPGTLPRKFHSDLKGCHALAACYGDISSERVFMRLEKLTCTERKTGEIVEVKVQGYVAGEDGRTGVRGSVVDRAGESMRNAMMGGFLSGIGEFLNQAHNPITFSPIAGLAQTGGNPMGMKDMVKHGAGKGVNNALDKYADFYIKRAEQVQPVIQVAAGRQVDIVFTEGISMGESLYRQALGRSNDQGRYHQIQALNEETRSQETWSQETQYEEPQSQKTVSDWTKSRD